MRIIDIAKYIIKGILLILSLSSCNSTKFLDADQLLLKKNEIKFLAKEKIRNKRTLKYELSTLYKQKENSKWFLFFPREYFYFKLQDPGDTTKFHQWKKRFLAEKPAIYDDELSNATAESMKYYLQYKGYYNAEVFYDDFVKGKKTFITYYVKPNKQYTIDSTFFYSDDPNIDKILNEISDQSLLKEGKGIDGNLYEREKDRISKHLRNNGFAYFYSNFFPTLEADTTLHPNKANLYFEVLPPTGDSLHQIYYNGDISIYMPYNLSQATHPVIDTIIDGYIFRSSESEFIVKPQTILESLYLKPGELFSQEKFEKTNDQLSQLGVFKFVRIKQEIDSSNANLLNFRIELSPNKKLELGLDFDLNYTNQSTSSGTGNLIGIAVSPSWRNRNLFNGAELLITNLTARLEIDPGFGDERFWNTIDLGIQSELFFPKFLDYLNLWKALNKIKTGKKKKLVSDTFYALMREKASTRLSASYNYLLVLNWYRYNLFHASYGYDMRKSNNDRLLINHIGVDFLSPTTEPDFDSLLLSNPFLERSFGQQLFVSLLFRDFSFLHNSRTNRFGESHLVAFNVEIAGAEVWLGNTIYNAFALEADTLKIGNIDFSQYLKFNADLRYYKQIKRESSFALRLNLGLARPFGFTSDVPYVKQFYVGGPNSIRSWAVRGLGPGGYLDTLAHDPNNRYRLNPDNRFRLFQTGDLKFEFNLEYRFNIFWRLKGAFFLDGGNVWTVRRDPGRCGSQFLFKSRLYDECKKTPENGLKADITNEAFFRQIALGGGFGMRIDFTYFIFRLDMGVRLRYPFQIDTGNGPSYWESFNHGWGLRDVSFNLGLGLPF